MLKVILSGIVGIIFGSVTTAYWLGDGFTWEKNETFNPDSSMEIPKDNTQAKISALENFNIKQEDASQPTTTHISYPEEGNENNNFKEIQDCDQLINKVTQSYLAKDKLISDIQSMKSGHEYDEKLQNAFDQENINYEWASNTQTKFIDMTRNNEQLRNITFSGITCKSSICEIKIPSADPNTANEAMNALASAPIGQALGFRNVSIKSKLETTAGEKTIYLVDEN